LRVGFKLVAVQNLLHESAIGFFPPKKYSWIRYKQVTIEHLRVMAVSKAKKIWGELQ